MTFCRRAFCSVLGAGIAAGAVPFATAQEAPWPSKPLRLLVGFPPGQASDILARVYADELTKTLGQSVVVENKPGAGATLAAELAARAPADGYTLYYGSSGPLAIAPHLYSKIRYDPLRDFEPVGTAGIVPMVLLVNANSPYKTIGELLAAGRGPEGSRINYGSAGSGGTSHLAMELFKTASGVKFTHVPYKGSVQSMTDLAGNSIQVALDTTGASLPFVRSGNLRVLAVGTSFRLPDMPNVPTIAESVPGFEATAWGMYLVPKGTPEPIVKRLVAEFDRLNALPMIKEKLALLGVLVSTRPYSDLKPFMERELVTWGKAVKVSGAKVD
jgi:tripartite-type tricarboxylate transporter receptor subunit TctC